MAKKKDEIVTLEEAQKRRKKKQKPTEPDNSALNKQVMDDDTITIADVKQFITDGKAKQKDWKLIADRSHNEVEKRNKDGNLFGGNDLYRSRQWVKFPLWWSCLKIRQPLVLARLPDPVLKDTQLNDPFGNTACILGERFIKSILKTFEPFPEFESCRDDLLVTNFGWGRPFYRVETSEEPEKVRLQVIQPPPPSGMPQMQAQGAGSNGGQAQESPPMQEMPPIFLTPDGTEVPQEEVQEDDIGPYILTGNDVTIDNEEIYWEAGLYPNLIIDPAIRKWNKVNELAFESEYSYNEFKEKFGKNAVDLLARGDVEDHRKGKPIIVFEYWNKFYKECRWFAENSDSFFQPKGMVDIDALKEFDKPDHSDLYGLSGFFPCTEPLSINQSTKHFWPTPEYFQVGDLINYVHESVGRMVQLSKAVRIRFFFDSSITELKTLIGENWAMGEGTGMGIPDLESTLMNTKGESKLANLVAYFPVDELLKGLETQYGNFQKGLDMFYQITGMSDLIRGQTNPDSDKTFGERQMEGKYALNRIEPFQYKMQDFIKNNYELMMEMGFKMFSDDTIDEYIMPQTLDDEDKQRYIPSLELLKNNKRRRFRVDFETDSTIAINEQWRKKEAIETANVITKMQESIAKTAQDMPELVESQLKVMQHVIGELTDGKLFIDEITESIEDVIKKVQAPKPPEFNKDEEQLKLDRERFVFDQKRAMTEDKLQQFADQMKASTDQAKVAQEGNIAKLQSQIDQFKIQSDTQVKMQQTAEKAQESAASLQLEYQKINASITETREQMELKRNELLVELRKIADKKEVDQFQVMIDARAAQTESVLGKMQIELEQTKTLIDSKNEQAQQARLDAQELRLEREHAMGLHTAKIDALHTVVEAALKHQELMNPPDLAQMDAAIPKAEVKPVTKITKVKRDDKGNITELVHKTVPEGK